MGASTVTPAAALHLDGRSKVSYTVRAQCLPTTFSRGFLLCATNIPSSVGRSVGRIVVRCTVPLCPDAEWQQYRRCPDPGFRIAGGPRVKTTYYGERDASTAGLCLVTTPYVAVHFTVQRATVLRRAIGKKKNSRSDFVHYSLHTQSVGHRFVSFYRTFNCHWSPRVRKSDEVNFAVKRTVTYHMVYLNVVQPTGGNYYTRHGVT